MNSPTFVPAGMPQNKFLKWSGVVVAGALMLTASQLGGADTPPNIVTLNLEPTQEHPRNSEGAFATLASGRIVFCYTEYCGGAADESPARIVRIQSDDQGRTWSQPVVVVVNTGGKNVMSVSLLRLASGKLALFYLVKNSWIDCRPHLRVSSDDGATWSDAQRVLDAPGYFVLNNDRVIQTRTGRLVMPLAFHRSRGSDPHSSKSFDARAIALWLYSDDAGATWREAATWWALPVPNGTGLQEPGVVELENGSLFAWSRTDQGAQFAFTSSDVGKTWTPPTPTEMKSPVSPASIKRLPNRPDLLAIYNDHSGRFPFSKGKRTPLVAAISADDGRTWPQAKLIENDPDGWYCYTAIHFAGDTVLLGYCAGDSKVGGLNRLRIRRVSLDWLRQP
jgi:sialidase-1